MYLLNNRVRKSIEELASPETFSITVNIENIF